MSELSEPTSQLRHHWAKQGEYFAPPWVFRNGHIQTLAGTYVFGRWSGRRLLPTNVSTTGEIPLLDGDRLAYEDDCPAEWKPGDLVVVMFHGLAGSVASPYMPRIARLFNQKNVRTIRVNWRGCGLGIELARYPYHSGRSADVLATLEVVKMLCRNSPIGLVGFSMGGNIVLKFLGEQGTNAAQLGVIRGLAACPPIDLSFTVDSLRFGLARFYDQYFCKACIQDVRRRQKSRPDAVIPEGWFDRPPKGMRQFDETFTAPVCGFESSDDYYSKSSGNQFVPLITVPTLIVAAQDDPVIPFVQFTKLDLPSCVHLMSSRHGGHMGYISAFGSGWLDRQIVEWITGSDEIPAK